jgi:VanZ family protein
VKNSTAKNKSPTKSDSGRTKLSWKLIATILYFAFAIMFFRSSQWSLLGPFVAVGLVLGSGIFVLPTLYSSFNSPKEGLPQKKSLLKKIVFGILACLLAFIIMIVFFFVLVLGA